MQNCSAQRKAARKSIFSQLLLSIFFFSPNDFWKRSLKKKRHKYMCPNHLVFTTQLKKRAQNLQRTQTGGVIVLSVPSSYLLSYIGRQGVLPPGKLTAEVNSVARLVAKKQGGGLQLPALSVLDEPCCVQLRRRPLLFLSQVCLAPWFAPCFQKGGSCPPHVPQCGEPHHPQPCLTSPGPSSGQVHVLFAGHI